jgi:thiol-disulfide isomerase/thioredoxin
VLVSFVDSHCGPCRALLPQLGRWQRELADRLTIAIVGRGDPDMLRSLVDHGHVEILVSEDGAVADAYAVEATPSAVLIAPDGSIASVLHYGAEGVEAVIVSLASVLHGNEASPRGASRDPSHALEVALVG